jgi:hypothetical protein
MIRSKKKRAKKVRRYAEGTKVPVERTRSEIEQLLYQHKATQFAIAWRDKGGLIQFELAGCTLRFAVDRPERSMFSKEKSQHRDALMDAEYRRRWRALLLILKAKLEVIASGDRRFDEEFLADILLPGGATVRAALAPQLKRAYETGEMPMLLGPGS